MVRKTIEAGRSATQALHRTARFFALRAARALASPVLSDTAVHDARKDLKRCRTVLRLIRPALGERVFRRENALLRDVAHALNAARDARVLTQTLESLRRRRRALQRDVHVAALLRTLQTGQEALRRRLQKHPEDLARTRGALARLCRRSSQWRVGADGWSVLGPALRRIYRCGRRRRPSARWPPTDEALHEWRKQVKYLRYALEILTPVRPRKLARLARQAEQLTDCLGEAHDLAVLRRKAQVFARRHRADLGPLCTVIDQRKQRLSLEARSRGRALYRARAGEWERLLQRYWIRWYRAE